MLEQAALDSTQSFGFQAKEKVGCKARIEG